jgi:hypothetical protein
MECRIDRQEGDVEEIGRQGMECRRDRQAGDGM